MTVFHFSRPEPINSRPHACQTWFWPGTRPKPDRIFTEKMSKSGIRILLFPFLALLACASPPAHPVHLPHYLTPQCIRTHLPPAYRTSCNSSSMSLLTHSNTSPACARPRHAPQHDLPKARAATHDRASLLAQAITPRLFANAPLSHARASLAVTVQAADLSQIYPLTDIYASMAYMLGWNEAFHICEKTSGLCDTSVFNK